MFQDLTMLRSRSACQNEAAVRKGMVHVNRGNLHDIKDVLILREKTENMFPISWALQVCMQQDTFIAKNEEAARLQQLSCSAGVGSARQCNGSSNLVKEAQNPSLRMSWRNPRQFFIAGDMSS